MFSYSCIRGNLFVHSWQLIRAFVATYSCIRGNKFFHQVQILFLLLKGNGVFLPNRSGVFRN